MLASRALLAKWVAAVLPRRLVCLVHRGGDWGNWGGTNITVVFSGCGWWDGTNIHDDAYLASMAPLLACCVLPSLEVSMGYERDRNSQRGRWPNINTVQAVKSMGGHHKVREPYEAYVDVKNKVISTPTFMWDTEYHYHYIFDVTGHMVKHVIRMAAK